MNKIDYEQVTISGGAVTSVIYGTKVPKFSCLGKPLVDTKLMHDACPDDTCLVGPTAKSLLPGLYKLKEFKDIPGLGMVYSLQVAGDQVGLCLHFI